MRGSHLGMRTPRVWRRCQRGVRTPSCERRPGAMRGSHLGMRIPRVGGRCQRGVRTPSCERRPGDDARFASGDANSAGGGALSTRSSHALVRTAARRRCAVRIWGCELRGWGGVVNAEFARPRANGGQGRCAVRIWGCAVRIWGCEFRGWGGVVNAEFARPRANGGQGRCAVRIWGCELRGWGGVVNAEFARPRANGGQETMRGSHLGMRTPRMGGRCQRGVRTPSCERRPGDDARFASRDANSADGGGVVNAEFARPRANGGQETMRGSHLGMRTPRVGGRCQRGVRTPTGERRPGDDARFASGDANSAGGGGRCQRGVRTPTGERWPGDDARFASGDANSADGGALSTRSSHAHGRTAARRRCAVRIWGCAVRIWGCELRGCGGVVNAEFARPRANGGQGRCAVRIWGCAVRIWGCELRGWGGVVNAEFARPRANGGQGRCAVRIWGCELRGWGGVVNAEFARPRANGGQGRCAVRIWGCELRGWGGRCQRGVRTPSCERRPGDDARFASGDANSAGGGALSTRSSHALVRTAARRRCAVRIWGCELRGWGGALSTRSSHAHGRTVARRRCAVRIWGCELRPCFCP
jgi:hypothetical protein